MRLYCLISLKLEHKIQSIVLCLIDTKLKEYFKKMVLSVLLEVGQVLLFEMVLALQYISHYLTYSNDGYQYLKLKHK